jgi:hypothetical protein
MEKLDQFTLAYLQCALFAETDNSDESGGLPLDQNYDVSDFTIKALKRAVADCKKFQDDNLEDILKTPDWRGSDSYTATGYTGLECAAHDFWFTRNGHGVGFWEREYYTKEERDRLTKASKEFGECYIYVERGKLFLE